MMHVSMAREVMVVKEQCSAFPSGLSGGVLKTFVVRLSSTMCKYGKDDGVQASDYLLYSTCHGNAMDGHLFTTLVRTTGSMFIAVLITMINMGLCVGAIAV